MALSRAGPASPSAEARLITGGVELSGGNAVSRPLGTSPYRVLSEGCWVTKLVGSGDASGWANSGCVPGLLPTPGERDGRLVGLRAGVFRAARCWAMMSHPRGVPSLSHDRPGQV